MVVRRLDLEERVDLDNVGGTSEAFLAASAPRVAQMPHQHPEPGPTWQQSAQRASSKQGWCYGSPVPFNILPIVRVCASRLSLGSYYSYPWGLSRSGKYPLASTKADCLSRGFILHHYRVSLTWPVLVFYASTLLLLGH